MMKDFRQSSDVGLPQLTGQISAHYSSSKIRKPNLRLFRPDQGPRAVLEVASKVFLCRRWVFPFRRQNVLIIFSLRTNMLPF